ncbi:TIGR03915 family putative DNA repair protein [Joostella sp. CR20]|uniref:TIGR03915 family putative DNA repair protein n=1 Tax=Joostella sp. CR20 TaxID=2804312 RepID=UPI00313E4BAA
MKTILIYDGSFTGFLTAVYRVFEANLKEVSIVKPKHYTPDMFATSEEIISSEVKAKRVWNSLEIKATKYSANQVYKAFLSEIKGTEDVLLRYIKYVYVSESFNCVDMSNVNALRVHQVARMVTREMHHVQDYLDFKTTEAGVDLAVVNSKFNLLPLIGSYFKRKYPTKKWFIYDARRDYGLLYDLTSVKQTTLDAVNETEILSRIGLHKGLLFVDKGTQVAMKQSKNTLVAV